MNGITSYPSVRPEAASRLVLRQRWADVAFVHWRVPEATVAERLPDGLVPDTFDGSAWVGLVAFEMRDVAPLHGPRLPWLGTFPETNVRTYVRDRSGRPGVWFDSLDAARLLPVVTARSLWNLPYRWSSMSTSAGATRRYTTDRLGSTSVRSRLQIRPRHEPADTPLEAFLVNRWRLFAATRAGRLLVADVDHDRWHLRRADLVHLDDELAADAGYPPPTEPPLVHHSTGVVVRAGRPSRLRWL